MDQYLLKTKPELLGQTGMRLRVMVRDGAEKKALLNPESKDSPAPEAGKKGFDTLVLLSTDIVWVVTYIRPEAR